MLGKWKILPIMFIGMLLAVPLISAEEDEAGWHFGFSLGIGTATFQEDAETVTYQKLILSPDISFGKFGLGLDLIFHYTFTGPPPGGTDFYVRPEDWVPSGDDTVLDVYLPKFKYIRYGFKGDPLFVKLGSMDDMTLGNGFIVNGYANTLFLPESRIFGLILDLDGALFGFPVFGFESLIGNLARLDVLAIRPYFRPLAATGIPLLEHLQVGATVAADRDPGLYQGSDADPILVYGLDFRQPLLANPAIELAVFGDIASIDSRSLGGAVGLGGRLIGFLLYGAQLRVLGEDFIPTYFDASYDLFRYEKYALVKTGGGNPAYTGWLGSLGLGLFQDALLFSAALDGPFAQPDPADETNYLNYPHLYALLRVREGLVPHFSMEASYDKRLIREFRDLVDPRDAVIQARLNYHVASAVISFLYNIRYVPTTGDWEVTSGLESAIQLF